MVQINVPKKLSTEKIRSLMTDWLIKAWPDALSRYENHEMVEEFRKEWQDSKIVTVKCSQKDLDADAEFMGLKPGLSLQEIRDGIKSLWHNPKIWKREEKRKLADHYSCYFRRSYNRAVGDYSGPICFDPDTSGEYNKQFDALINDSSFLERCILRVFVPLDGLGETFRLEVISSPDDSDIVGWTLIAD